MKSAHENGNSYSSLKAVHVYRVKGLLTRSSLVLIGIMHEYAPAVVCHLLHYAESAKQIVSRTPNIIFYVGTPILVTRDAITYVVKKKIVPNDEGNVI